MMINRISNCLGTLRKRTGPRQLVLKAWSCRVYSSPVRLSYVHPIFSASAFTVFLADPLIGVLPVAVCLMLIMIDWRSSASGMASIKIDGASHAEQHVLCRSGQTCKKEKQN